MDDADYAMWREVFLLALEGTAALPATGDYAEDIVRRASDLADAAVQKLQEKAKERQRG